MKIGKETNRYCPKCKKHTVNTISIYKAGKQRKSSLGARNHEKIERVMADKNSQNSNVPQKQPRKLHYVTNVRIAVK